MQGQQQIKVKRARLQLGFGVPERPPIIYHFENIETPRFLGGSLTSIEL